MKEMIDVFGKKYSLNTLKAHGIGYNQTIEDATKKALDKYKMIFKTSKKSFFSSEIDIKIIQPNIHKNFYND